MITVNEIKEAIASLVAVTDEIEALEEKIKPLTQEKMALRSKLTQMLNEVGETKFSSEFGTLSKVTDFTVKLPQGEQKLEFFEFLKNEGLFESMATINHQTLNAFFKERRELAIADGDPMAALNFSLPGIGEAKSFETVKLRRNNK